MSVSKNLGPFAVWFTRTFSSNRRKPRLVPPLVAAVCICLALTAIGCAAETIKELPPFTELPACRQAAAELYKFGLTYESEGIHQWQVVYRNHAALYRIWYFDQFNTAIENGQLKEPRRDAVLYARGLLSAERTAIETLDALTEKSAALAKNVSAECRVNSKQIYGSPYVWGRKVDRAGILTWSPFDNYTFPEAQKLVFVADYDEHMSSLGKSDMAWPAWAAALLLVAYAVLFTALGYEIRKHEDRTKRALEVTAKYTKGK